MVIVSAEQRKNNVQLQYKERPICLVSLWVHFASYFKGQGRRDKLKFRGRKEGGVKLQPLSWYAKSFFRSYKLRTVNFCDTCEFDNWEVSSHRGLLKIKWGLGGWNTTSTNSEINVSLISMFLHILLVKNMQSIVIRLSWKM